ncbi:aspartate aminotransferase [Colletotrichum camelliae]|nr:aspartate aminotransferase [Colletotrichum camelliae]
MNKEFHPQDTVTANDLFVTPGLASGLDAVAWSVCDEGEGILVPQPFYNGFSFDLLNRSNTRVIGVSYQGIEGYSNLEDVFRPEVNRSALEAALEKARREDVTVRALLISKCYSPETLREFASFCGRNRLHFISDEIYAKSVFPNPAISGQSSFVSVLSLDFRDIIDSSLMHVLYGASKDFCANGLRLGMVYTKNEAMLGAMSSISMFSWSPHVLQDVWASMMDNQTWMESFMVKKTELMVENYRAATSFFREHNISYFDMNAGLFIWVDLRHLFSPSALDGKLKVQSESFIAHQQRELEITDLCARHGVMIAPGSVYMPEEFGWFRVTFSLGKEALKEGLRRFARAIAEMRR